MSKDIFLKLEGIIGESTDMDHRMWIEVDSFDCTVAAAGGDDDSIGACTHSPISITKSLDIASPKLALYACQLKPITTAFIEVCRPAGITSSGGSTTLGDSFASLTISTSSRSIPYLKIMLTNVLITSYKVSGSEGVPSDDVTLKYEKIQWHYVHTHHQTGAIIGNVISHWDTAKNIGG